MAIVDKVALVLGGIKGIGRAVALALAEAGARVVTTYWDWQESLPEMQAAFAPFGERQLIRRTNLLEADQIEALVAEAVARFGRLDILVNNIERGGWPVVHGAYVPEQWDLEMATTLRAKWWVFNAALPHLKASGDGAVINFSSIAGVVGRSGPASLIFNDGYAAANRGVSLLTETWARAAAPAVRVNEIMLGIFETRHAEHTRGWGLLTAEEQQAVRDHTLLGRTGAISDVLKAVRFLIEDAPFMTGAVLRLDGGYVLGGEAVAAMPRGVLGPESPGEPPKAA